MSPPPVFLKSPSQALPATSDPLLSPYTADSFPGPFQEKEERVEIQSTSIIDHPSNVTQLSPYFSAPLPSSNAAPQSPVTGQSAALPSSPNQLGPSPTPLPPQPRLYSSISVFDTSLSIPNALSPTLLTAARPDAVAFPATHLPPADHLPHHISQGLQHAANALDTAAPSVYTTYHSPQAFASSPNNISGSEPVTVQTFPSTIQPRPVQQNFSQMIHHVPATTDSSYQSTLDPEHYHSHPRNAPSYPTNNYKNNTSLSRPFFFTGWKLHSDKPNLNTQSKKYGFSKWVSNDNPDRSSLPVAHEDTRQLFATKPGTPWQNLQQSTLFSTSPVPPCTINIEEKEKTMKRQELLLRLIKR